MLKKTTNFYLLLLLNLCLLGSSSLLAQNVGIGTASPHVSAKLEIQDSNKGLLVPRIDIPNLTAAAPVTTPEVSLLVYNTNTTTGIGYYYWDGSQWIRLQDQSVGDHDWYEVNTTTSPDAISDNIFTLGHVGIGTIAPTTVLNVEGGFGSAFLINSGASDGGKIYTKYVNGMAHLAFEEYDDPFILEGFTSLSGQSTILSMYNSKLGIGTTSPTETLDVYGTIAYTRNQYNDLIIHDDTFNLNNDNISIEFVKKGNHVTPSAAIKFDGFSAPTTHEASMYFYTKAQTDPSLQEQMMIHSNGNIGMGINTPTEKLEVNGSVKITDGTQGVGKVLTSDATGKGSWELPSAAPALVPPVQLGPMAVGDVCPVGGSYTTASVTLEPGIYNYTLYSCANQIGQVGSGFGIGAVFLSGSGDASSTWHNTSTGSCGHYYTGIVRVTTTSQIAIRYSSYSGSSFQVPGANTEIAQFWKIN